MKNASVTVHTCVVGILEISLEGVDTFQQAADDSGDGLRALFQSLIRQRQEFITDLVSLILPAKSWAAGEKQLDHLVEPCPLPAYAGRRTEAAVLDACSREENKAVTAYELALLRNDLPRAMKKMFQEQLTSVQASRDRIADCQKGS